MGIVTGGGGRPEDAPEYPGGLQFLNMFDDVLTDDVQSGFSFGRSTREETVQMVRTGLMVTTGLPGSGQLSHRRKGPASSECPNFGWLMDSWP